MLIPTEDTRDAAPAPSIPPVPGRTSAEWALASEWMGVVADLAGSAALLSWDRETLMPPGGADGRAKQLGTLAALHHQMDGHVPLIQRAKTDARPLRPALPHILPSKSGI